MRLRVSWQVDWVGRPAVAALFTTSSATHSTIVSLARGLPGRRTGTGSATPGREARRSGVVLNLRSGKITTQGPVMTWLRGQQAQSLGAVYGRDEPTRRPTRPGPMGQ